MSIFGKKKESKELVAQADRQESLITKETVRQYMQTFGLAGSLTPQEQEMYMAMAVEFQLNPLKKELYAIPYENKDGTRTLSLVTGYEVYLRRAEASGRLAWWTVKIEGEYEDTRAVVRIGRKDRDQEFSWEVWMSEVAGVSPFWRKMPKHMLRKVAIAQAFRMCFPEEFNNMPYIEEEMDNAVRDVTPVDKSDMPRPLDRSKDVGEERLGEEPKEVYAPDKQDAPPPRPEPAQAQRPEQDGGQAASPQSVGSRAAEKKDIVTYVNTHGNIPNIEKAKIMGQLAIAEKNYTPEELPEAYSKALGKLKEKYGE